MPLAAFLLVSHAAQVFSAAFSLAAAFAAWRLLRPRFSGGSGFTPPITIMKPLKGAEGSLYENLRSFCAQDYPVFQIIFCVSSREDPALAVIARLCEDFPALDLESVVSGRPMGRNPKISNLANAYGAAKHDFLLIADSDVRVPRDFLSRSIRFFQDADLGLLTCFYRSVPGRGFWSRLEAASINFQFLPQALAAAAMGQRFAMGAAMLARRTAFDKAGGFENLADHIADDYVLGQAVMAAGRRIDYADMAVASTAEMKSLPEFAAHRIRESRTIRICRPGGYLGMFLLHGFSFWTVEMLVSGFYSPWAFSGIALWALKILAFGAWREACLWPLTEWLAAAAWLAGFGSRVKWRGEIYTLERGGRLVCASQSVENI